MIVPSRSKKTAGRNGRRALLAADIHYSPLELVLVRVCDGSQIQDELSLHDAPDDRRLTCTQPRIELVQAFTGNRNTEAWQLQIRVCAASNQSIRLHDG